MLRTNNMIIYCNYLFIIIFVCQYLAPFIVLAQSSELRVLTKLLVPHIIGKSPDLFLCKQMFYGRWVC